MYAFTTKYNGLGKVLVNEVGLSIPYDLSHGIQDPALTIKAIWDTGASMSTLTKKVVQQLKLQPTGKMKVRNTSEEKLRDSYILNLYLPNRVMIPFVKVVDCEDVLGGADMLIGMDIITMGDFAITNFNGKTTFSFVTPAKRTIDYVEELNQINQRIPVLTRIEEEKKRRMINAATKSKKKRKKRK